MGTAIDILILSNGPGEITTWVRPVVKALRQRLGHDRAQVRLSLVLSPCANASGREVAIAQRYPELDRVQGAEHFFPFLLWGKTAQAWDWRDRGVVLFLGGDQVYPVVIGKRLGYRTVLYAEWETRWHAWIDRFAVMKPDLVTRAPARFAPKFTVVGDLMSDLQSPTHDALSELEDLDRTVATEWVGLLPGSKAAKLAQGVPLTLAIAHHIHQARPHTRFVLPVAPTLEIDTLLRFADRRSNPVARYFGDRAVRLVPGPHPTLETSDGVQIHLWTEFPAHAVLARCRLCLTTVGANTAELGALAVPMIVLLPTQQLDAMRAWDGIPGLLANLPGVGFLFARLINGWFLRRSRLWAWPNIWAGEAIVPELVGQLDPADVAALVLEWLEHPQTLSAIRARLQAVRGKPGAAFNIAQMVAEEAQWPHRR